MERCLIAAPKIAPYTSDMRISFMGHLSIDRNVIKGSEHILYGGGVVHAGVTATRLGADATVVTKCAPADRSHFTALAEAKVRTEYLPSASTTSIRNDYPSDNPDERLSRLVARGDPFTEEDLRFADAPVVHVNPLWNGELPPALLERLRERVRTLGGDAQGFLRTARADGRLENQDWADKARYLPLFDLFKVDIKEAGILTGEQEPRRAAAAVAALGPRTVLLTHQGGVCVYEAGRYFEAPFTAATLEGRTGRGDTCTAAFFIGRDRFGNDLAEATRFAARITSEKMQYRGAYRG